MGRNPCRAGAHASRPSIEEPMAINETPNLSHLPLFATLPWRNDLSLTAGERLSLGYSRSQCHVDISATGSCQRRDYCGCRVYRPFKEFESPRCR